MSWGLPPKYKTEHYFRNTNISVPTINQSVEKALIKCGFRDLNSSTYIIRGVKKLRMSFLSFFAFSKPRVIVDVYITKKGRITLQSRYDYGSMFGMAMNDGGKQKKEMDKLLSEIIELTKLNHQQNPITDEEQNINDASAVIIDIEQIYNH